MTRKPSKPIGLDSTLQFFEDDLFDDLKHEILSMPLEALSNEFSSRGLDLNKSAEEAWAKLGLQPPFGMSSPPTPPSVQVQTHVEARANKKKPRAASSHFARSAHGPTLTKAFGNLHSAPRLRMAAGATLASGAAVYSGFEMPIEKLFDDVTLRGPVAWATGFLRLIFARSNEGKVRSIKASIDVAKPPKAGAQIILALRDPKGSTTILRLRSDKPSMVVQDTPLRSEVDRLHLTVSLSMD